MAQVSNLKSTALTNRDAVPKVLSDPFIGNGELQSAIGSVTTLAADSIGSTYRMLQVPSNARIDTVKIQNAALGTACTVNVGVYWPTFIPVGSGLLASNQGAAISASFFAATFSVATAGALTEITNQSTTNTIALQEQPLWQAIGLASDPGIDLDIVVTVAAATVNAALIGLKVAFVA